MKRLPLSYFAFTLLIAVASISRPVSAEQERSAEDEAYRFKLVKGAGVSVCDAYLERLNIMDYSSPPYCDRPESEDVPGFTELNRVPLSVEDVQILLPRIQGFTQHRNQDFYDFAKVAKESRGMRPSQNDLLNVKDSLGRDLKGWRYDPVIDIDNDGAPDNIIVWHGFGASGYTGRCGQGSPYDKGHDTLLRQAQLPYVLTRDNEHIDVFKTMTIFGHPSGGYRFSIQDGRKILAEKFRPIGLTMGIFKYQDLYYFDTFFDQWGDFQDQRGKQADIHNTLAVFLRKEGKTQQICEYQMTGIENITRRKN
ncbi:MAG TPA: hypothetical protein VM532_04590 [Burkholderiales bacterium]|nr:hypothetical protein [Burkholderiales bacterium]